MWWSGRKEGEKKDVKEEGTKKRIRNSRKKGNGRRSRRRGAKVGLEVRKGIVL
jgi:hypothetical protein